MAGAAVVLCVVAVAAALVSQHRFGMLPCPWCVLQRVIFLAIALAALPALLRSLPVRRVSASLMLTGALAGVAAALWQHFVAAGSSSCNLTLADRINDSLGLADRWPEVFAAYATCADAAVNLLGLPYEFWSLGLFVVLAAIAAGLIRQPG
ncbi:MAG: disulfide bond formation protein B [Chitinophagaceae bacterium]|nr:disulfide bond formation protein B [Rubrivivax sp.]